MPKKRRRKNRNFNLFKMKKVIFGFIATAMFTTVSFANSPTLENKVEVIKENQTVNPSIEKKEVETLCTWTCTAIMADGTVYTATAGGFLTSCSNAEKQCKAKLFDKIMGIE